LRAVGLEHLTFPAHSQNSISRRDSLFIQAPRDDRDLRARFGQADGRRCANASGAASYQGGFAR
jgi:hypothetical protein